MKRSEIRIHIFKLVYQNLFNENLDNNKTFSNYLAQEFIEAKPKKDDLDFILNSCNDIIKNLDFLDQKITEALDKWNINRISKIDLCIMRVSIYEIFFKDDIPLKVAINEAIEIAKIYGEDNSPQFINGILGKVVDLKKE